MRLRPAFAASGRRKSLTSACFNNNAILAVPSFDLFMEVSCFPQADASGKFQLKMV
jgi:hypothetical protein